MNEPTPEEAAAALRAVHQGKERVVRSAMGSPWLWIGCGLAIFLYCLVEDLEPAVRSWLVWPFVAVCLALSVLLRTRVGSALFGRSVTVSARSLDDSLRWRLLRTAPIFVFGVAAAAAVALVRLPHALIYYGALAGLYVAFVGPRFRLWIMRRQEKA